METTNASIWNNLSYMSLTRIPLNIITKREAYNSETTIVEGGCLCPTSAEERRSKWATWYKLVFVEAERWEVKNVPHRLMSKCETFYSLLKALKASSNHLLRFGLVMCPSFRSPSAGSIAKILVSYRDCCEGFRYFRERIGLRYKLKFSRYKYVVCIIDG